MSLTLQATELWDKLRGISVAALSKETDPEKRNQEMQNLLTLFQIQETILSEQEVALVESEVGKRAGMEEMSSPARKYILTCKVHFSLVPEFGIVRLLLFLFGW